MVAVLKSSLQDIASGDFQSPLFRDAYKWCMETFPYTGAYRRYVFSFESVCLHLNIDKSLLQTKLRERYAESKVV